MFRPLQTSFQTFQLNALVIFQGSIYPNRQLLDRLGNISTYSEAQNFSSPQSVDPANMRLVLSITYYIELELCA